MDDRETARMRKYGESKTTRIMMATVPHVTSGLGLRKFQADGFLLTRVYIQRGTRWRSWFRHCATDRKVAGSIPDGVIGIFQRHNPSGHTMTLGLTQPLTEMCNTNISWG